MAEQEPGSFKTLVEAGDYVKSRNRGNLNLLNTPSERVGFDFYESRIDGTRPIQIGEFRSADTPLFPYVEGDWTERPGVSVLKTMGNLPYSAYQMYGDMATAALSPIESATTLGRAGLGMAESMVTDQPISPTNRLVYEQMKQGLSESLSPRSIMERPLDAASNVAFGASTAAKTPGLLARLTKAAISPKGISKAPKPPGKGFFSRKPKETMEDVFDAEGNVVGRRPFREGNQPDPNLGGSEGVVGAGKFPGFGGDVKINFPGSTRARIGNILDQVSDYSGSVGATIDRYDPANVLMRVPGAVTKQGLNWGWKASKYGAKKAKKAVFDPALDFGKASFEVFNNIVENSPMAEKLRTWRQTIKDKKKSPSMLIREFYNKGKEKTQEQARETFGQEIKLPGFGRGLLENIFGFTWNVGDRMVHEMFEIAMDPTVLDELDRRGSQVMLDAIRQEDVRVAGRKVSGDAVVGRRLMTKINNAVKTYVTRQKEIQNKLREPLRMEIVAVPIRDFKAKLQRIIPTQQDALGNITYDFSPFFGETGQTQIRQVLDSIFQTFDEADANITLKQLDDFKQMVGDARYGKQPPNQNALKVLDQIYQVTRDYIGEVADNPELMNAKLAKLREEGVEKWLNENVNEWRYIPSAVLKDFDVQLFGEFVGVDPAQYSAAMRQHFDFVTFMDRLKEDLRLVDPESKRFVEVTDEFDTVFDSEGNKVYQEFSKQAVDDKKILRTLTTMFADPDGFALETFKDLAQFTDNPTLLAELIGYSLRPNLAGGLSPKGQIGGMAREVGGGLAHPLAMGIAAVEFLPALTMFSPKYGSQILIRAFSPEGQKFWQDNWQYWKEGSKDIVAYYKQAVPEEYERMKTIVARDLGVSRDKVDLAQVEQYFDDYFSVNEELRQLPKGKRQALKDLVLGGRFVESTEGAMERMRRQLESETDNKYRKNNLLVDLRNVGQNRPLDDSESAALKRLEENERITQMERDAKDRVRRLQGDASQERLNRIKAF